MQVGDTVTDGRRELTLVRWGHPTHIGGMYVMVRDDSGREFYVKSYNVRKVTHA